MSNFLTDSTLKNIRQALEKTYLSHSQIAKECGCGVSTVQRFKDHYDIKRPEGYDALLQKQKRENRKLGTGSRYGIKIPNEVEIQKIFAGFSFANNALNIPAQQVAAQ